MKKMKRKRKVPSVAEIELYFKKHGFTSERVELNAGEAINNQKLFVDNHVEMLKANPNNKTMIPAYNRLLQFYCIKRNEPFKPIK